MVPMFTAVDDKLEGWACDCGHTEQAILRERQFTRETYNAQKADVSDD